MSTPTSLQESNGSSSGNSKSISTTFLDNFSLEDKSFDISNSEVYHLSIELSNTGLTYCVLDLDRNKYLVVEHISFNISLGLDFPLALVKKAFDSNPTLKNRFKSVSVALINNEATLIPSTIFDDGRALKFLQMNLEDNSTVGTASQRGYSTDELNELKSVNLYYLSKEVINFLRSTYQNVQIKHHSSILIQSALLRYKNQHKKKLLIHFHKECFEILVIEDNHLKLYNSFSYQSKEDFVYYILFACEQLSLNPEQIETEVLGELDKHSDYYSLLYTYIRNIAIAKRPENFDYSYQFEDLPAQYYYNLFSQYQCV